MEMPRFYPVACHTDRVGPGSVFVAINGLNHNGTQFIPTALKRGASTIVIDRKEPIDMAMLDQFGADLIRVADTRKALAKLSASAASYPADHLKCIGITGTKGKTISAWLTAHILKTAGHKTALISTVANFIGDVSFETSMTTPQPDYLQQFLKLCADESVEYVVMEVAAQALTLHRVDYIEFDAVLFTNFALEHLEFYDSLSDYFTAKCQLIKKRKPGAPIWLNADDELLKNLQCDNSHFYSIHKDKQFLSRLKAPNLPGEFNQYNMLGAAKIAQSFGVSQDSIAQAINTFKGVPGRLQKHMLPNGATAIIDYAHNPLSYQALLSYLRTQTEHLIVVFGAGGKRDASRRPKMGAVASAYAHMIVLTSDNPRDEDPRAIAQDIHAGIPDERAQDVHIELDRALAIKYAYEHSKPGSIIAILGKGPDEVQIIGSQVIPFSERAILEAFRGA